MQWCSEENAGFSKGNLGSQLMKNYNVGDVAEEEKGIWIDS